MRQGAVEAYIIYLLSKHEAFSELIERIKKNG